MKSAPIYRAGIIPYILTGASEVKMMFMKPSDSNYGGDDFQMAKGKIDPGENAEQAAIREGFEELGLFKHNIVKLSKLGVFLGRTTVFIAEIKDPNLFGDPHSETGEVTWLTPEQFDIEGRLIHKPIIKAAHRLIEEQNNNN